MSIQGPTRKLERRIQSYHSLSTLELCLIRNILCVNEFYDTRKKIIIKMFNGYKKYYGVRVPKNIQRIVLEIVHENPLGIYNNCLWTMIIYYLFVQYLFKIILQRHAYYRKTNLI